MINKISHPSFKSIYVQESMYNQMTPENRNKIKVATECLDYMYHYTHDIAIFNNEKGDVCYHIQRTHPMTMLLHPEAIKFFKNPEQALQQVVLAVTMTNIYNNIHNIKIPILKGTIKDIDHKTVQEVGLQLMEEVEKFNDENPQKEYTA